MLGWCSHQVEMHHLPCDMGLYILKKMLNYFESLFLILTIFLLLFSFLVLIPLLSSFCPKWW